MGRSPGADFETGLGLVIGHTQISGEDMHNELVWRVYEEKEASKQGTTKNEEEKHGGNGDMSCPLFFMYASYCSLYRCSV